MEPAEYANLERVERDHWYYAGKRELVRRWIDRVRPPSRADALIDFGAGTGSFAKEMERQCSVTVLDDHEESLRILRSRFAPDRVVGLVDGEVPLPDASFEYVTALDVLEHTPDDRKAAESIHRLLKPGGIAIVTVPAGMALWSDWDVGLHHHRRYSRDQLLGLFPSPRWTVVHVNYTNFFIYPAVWLVRKCVRRRPGARHEDRVPAAWVNAALRSLFVGQGMMRRPRFPFGVSLLLIARKTAL